MRVLSYPKWPIRLYNMVVEGRLHGHNELMSNLLQDGWISTFGLSSDWSFHMLFWEGEESLQALRKSRLSKNLLHRASSFVGNSRSFYAASCTENEIC